MADKPRSLINMGDYLQSKGYEFSRIDDAGQHYVIDPNGEEVKFDAPGFLKSKGYDPDKFDVQFNKPTEALDISPLGIIDRGKMALGNARGNVNYLKSKFDQVAVDPEQGVLVKNKGVWQKVDPAGLGGGDAWEMSKELAKDLTEGAVRYVPSMALSTAGAAGAGLLAIPTGPGAVAASMAGAGGGAAAAEGIRTSLGRLVGTYDATPEEQLHDIGWEALLNAGGQGVALGVKPGLAMLKGALKPISEQAAPAAKDALAQFWGLTTGAGSQRVRIALDAPDQVVGSLAKVSKAGSAMEAENMLKEHTISEAKALMAPARKALTSKYGELQGDFLESVPANMEFQIGDVMKSTQLAMQKAGLGEVEVGKNGISKFKLFDQETMDKNLAKGNIPDVIDTKSLEAIQDFVTEMNKFSNVPTLKGKTGAENVLKIKRALSDSFYSITEDRAPNIKRAVAQFSSDLNQNLGSVFDDAAVPGLSEKYSSMADLYSKYSGAVNEADRMLREVNGAEVFVNKLTSGAGANSTLKGTAGDLAELLGKPGEERINRILAADAARGFVGYMPNLGKLNTAGAAAMGAGTFAAAHASPVTAAAAASQTSPRLVLKQIEYAKKFKDFLSGMTPAMRAQYLRNPQAVQGSVRTLFEAFNNEDKQTQQLLQQSGAVPPQQGDGR